MQRIFLFFFAAEFDFFQGWELMLNCDKPENTEQKMPPRNLYLVGRFAVQRIVFP